MIISMDSVNIVFPQCKFALGFLDIIWHLGSPSRSLNRPGQVLAQVLAQALAKV